MRMGYRYVGDLSQQDAGIIERYASQDRGNVLEFGAGASTQIIAQALARSGTAAILTSIETDPAWIDVTAARLRRMGVINRVRFLSYADWLAALGGPYDLIFDDGVDKLRLDFALRAWPLLRVGGAMLFHDTRRPVDAGNVLELARSNYLEIREIRFNEPHEGTSSNITAVVKKAREPYVNWNHAERRERWQIGYGEPPEDFWPRR